MTVKKAFLTPHEYAQSSGLSIPQVTRLLRQGRLRGRKIGNRWQIPLDTNAAQAPADAPAGPTFFTVDEFAAMTYLTPWGVVDWLKTGRLKRVLDADGNWVVDAGCLEHPDVRRILR